MRRFFNQDRQFLYAAAEPSLNDTWLIIPTLERNGRYSFVALDPEGQEWVDDRRTYHSPKAAVRVGKVFVLLTITELMGEVG